MLAPGNTACVSSRSMSTTVASVSTRAHGPNRPSIGPRITLPCAANGPGDTGATGFRLMKATAPSQTSPATTSQGRDTWGGTAACSKFKAPEPNHVSTQALPHLSPGLEADPRPGQMVHWIRGTLRFSQQEQAQHRGEPRDLLLLLD